MHIFSMSYIGSYAPLPRGHNSATNEQTMADNNPNIDLVNINAYTKLVEILSICSKDIEWT